MSVVMMVCKGIGLGLVIMASLFLASVVAGKVFELWQALNDD